jgi:Na+/melibiose symporter-like transporter
MLYILFLVGLIGLCSGLILNVRLKSKVSKRLFFYGLGLMLVATALATIVYRIWETPGELVHDLVFSAIFAAIASGIGLILDRGRRTPSS